MSFIKISDPKRRDEIIREYLRTKRSIQQQSFDKILEDKNIYTKQEKLFKPIIDAQKDEGEKLQKELQKVSKSVDQLTMLPPGAEGAPLPIEGEPIDEREKMVVGPLAFDALSRQEFNDIKRGLVRESVGNYRIGEQKVEIKDDDFIINGKVYKGTPGLWNLITMKKPGKDDFTNNDLKVYKDIMISTNALRIPGTNTPRSAKTPKWNNIQSLIWEEQKELEGISSKKKGKKKGKGVEFLPSDSMQLLNQLKLAFASNQAGNTGERNKIVSILEALLGMGQITKNEYKTIAQDIK